MANTNSFAENINQLTDAAAKMVEVAKALNDTITGNDASVNIMDGYSSPSYQYTLDRLNRTEKTVSTFVEGNGVVELEDGSYRKVRVDTLSRPPKDITFADDASISTFDIDSNWFFEAFQYPRCVVKINLKGQIDDDSDRVFVNRVIINTTQNNFDDNKKQNILSGNYDYFALIDYLNNNNVEYSEDKDEIKLPLTYEKYYGRFEVTSISLLRNSETQLNENWYYLDTINYSSVTEYGDELNDSHVLSKGDYLRYKNSLFKIEDINQAEKRVRLGYAVGYESIGVYDTVEFYNDPFSEKVISIGIGLDEIDVIYVKGVNENYNLTSKDWSNPISFFTNDLSYINEDGEKFNEYHARNVADFGRKMIAFAKENHISSYFGKVPNAPTLVSDDLKVVQINTQLEATLDTEKYNNLRKSISETKNNIDATRKTLDSNKTKLISRKIAKQRTELQAEINSNTTELNNYTTQFDALVNEINTMLTEANAINYTPKYHVRGFFAIPDSQYEIEDKKYGRQEIIGFETMYRYIHTDDNGTALNQFDYTDTSTGLKKIGVFSDWNLSVSSFLEKTYDSETDSYKWVNEKIDGTTIAINQIDIPIRSGEKVEIKVRSISEAGYPYAPLKSEWSNSVIIDYPDDLSTNDSVTSVLDSVRNDMIAVTLQETLSSAGIYEHISDSNSKFKHSAENIEYTETVIDENGDTTVVTMSLAEKIRALSALITDTQKAKSDTISYSTTTDSSGNISAFTVETGGNLGEENEKTLKSNLTLLTNTIIEKTGKQFDDTFTVEEN